MTAEELIQRAIALAEEKMQAGAGGPFGALIAQNGEIVAEGWNRVTSDNDPTAHAEVSAIRAACKAIGDFQLSGYDLYTSCEPCPLCLAAAYWARIDRIFYANTRQDAAAIGFDDVHIYNELALPIERRRLPMIRLEDPRAIAVFQAWQKKEDKITY